MSHLDVPAIDAWMSLLLSYLLTVIGFRSGHGSLGCAGPAGASLRWGTSASISARTR